MGRLALRRFSTTHGHYSSRATTRRGQSHIAESRSSESARLVTGQRGLGSIMSDKVAESGLNARVAVVLGAQWGGK